MSALLRINLLVTLLFVLITAVCLALLVRQAGYDVQSEMQAPKRWSTACAVRRALRVLDELLDGLQQVGQGVQADNAELTQALLALQEHERTRSIPGGCGWGWRVLEMAG
ncbi:MAG TPA: hypothetical protein VLG17_23095 [Pseudomonas sp.]|uniref:hypothetical protein n=1 Tax=Pseudomonas sp. TaxID=306 RepID=UPI002C76A1FC|nr:hypothetical protein [Pseudomonas sp.]HSX90875.1 hypothetical protein [Pseudomonas sp.]